MTTKQRTTSKLECPNCGFVKECESDIEKNFIKLILENNELERRIKELESKGDDEREE